ncbi:FAD-dependent oxidoreductase, partial [Cupriavidus sp. 2MCAB6]
VMLIRRALLRDGIALHERATILRVETPRNRVRLVLAGTKSEAELPLEGTHLLVTSNRQPAIAALDLELAGIASDAGGIVVNKGLRTANRRVFAIGGCASGNRHGAHLAHAASHQASLVLRNILFRLPVKTDAAALPRVT